MIVERVEAQEYHRLFTLGAPGVHLYNSAPFCELVGERASEVSYLIFRDSKVRAGLPLGSVGDALRSPWSAPFGGYAFTKEQTVATVDAIVDATAGYAASKAVEITLPPAFMWPSMSAKVASALLRCGALLHADLNYHYPLGDIESFEQRLDRSARQKLHEAQRYPWQFEILDRDNPADIARAYAVIKANRDAHGYPLRMSLESVQATAPVARTRFMVMSTASQGGGDCTVDVAAAIVQEVTAEVAQVVYWGDVAGFSHLRPMNIFPLYVMRAMAAEGFKHLDIGPSSSGGVPDYGLIVYKESLGCLTSLKPTFRL